MTLSTLNYAGPFMEISENVGYLILVSLYKDATI